MAEKTATNASTASENLYMQLNASELSAIIMKGSPNSNDRDAGFCSGSSEGGDDLSMDHSRLDPSSPTDASEDSVEVKVSSIALIRNKRKSSEPSKVICEREETSMGPLKKRIRYTSNADSAVVLTPPAAHSPAPAALSATAATAVAAATAAGPLMATASNIPWDANQRLPHELMPNPAQVFVRHPGVTTLHRLPIEHNDGIAATAAINPAHIQIDDVQEEPLALVLRKSNDITSAATSSSSATKQQEVYSSAQQKLTAHNNNTQSHQNKMQQQQHQQQHSADTFSVSLPLPQRPQAAASVSSSLDEQQSSSFLQNTSSSTSTSRPHQRNYKNMTRERRIEANARERTRVHTISAAYETLRKAVPSYSNSQKLSKLSVLRVACSYILTLSRLAGEDYSEDQSEPSIASCFEAVTATIQTEGKIRKKKDE